MNVIIFSKDRAAQLDLLLRSMPEFPLNVNILYNYSNDKFSAAYDQMLDEQDQVNDEQFTEQDDFKENLIDIVAQSDPLIVFFTDDDIFINPLPEIPDLPDNVACLSLRLNPHMDYCYTLNRPQKPPKMQNNIWDWRNADADYGYPMSLDGHIFRTADILPLLEKLDYHNPNTLEGQLARHPINRPCMMCFDKSVIVNNPINRVQDTVPNRHGTVTAEWLNEQFLAGKRIKLEPFIGIEPNACHVELPIVME
jgi:hypothetical protein